MPKYLAYIWKKSEKIDAHVEGNTLVVNDNFFEHSNWKQDPTKS